MPPNFGRIFQGKGQFAISSLTLPDDTWSYIIVYYRKSGNFIKVLYFQEPLKNKNKNFQAAKLLNYPLLTDSRERSRKIHLLAIRGITEGQDVYSGRIFKEILAQLDTGFT